MRFVLRTISVAAVAAAALCASAAAKPRRPVALHLRWHLVSTRAADIAASDRYVAIVNYRGPDGVSPITLIDEQQGTRQTLTPPGCPQPTNPMFGGPYLLVVCDLPSGFYELFGLASGQWAGVKASCPSQAVCRPAGVGRYWLKLAARGAECFEHCVTSYLLQNLVTGADENDPATPGGPTFDDLNAPSASRRLCSPLRYPRALDDAGRWEPGQLTFRESFAFAAGTQYMLHSGVAPVYRLRRCGSRLNLSIPPTSLPMLSSRIMLWQDGATGFGNRRARLAGRFLPGLGRFLAFGAPAPTNPYLRVQLAAVTRRTIYMRADSGALWEAPLPQ